MYTRVNARELEDMAAIKEVALRPTVDVSRQGEDVFCVKKQLAALWHANNGQSLLLGHAQVADLRR